MLGKLLKYEMRATGRWFLPMYALLLLMAGVNRIFMAIRDSSYAERDWSQMPGVTDRFRDIPVILATTLYVFIIAAVFIVTFVIIIQRFYKNLMGDEGYLMFTLPVHAWENIVSKLLVAMFWMLVSSLAVVLSIMLIVVNQSFMENLSGLFGDILDVFRYWDTNGVMFFWLLFVELFISLIYSVLHIYVSIAIGQLSNNHKVLCSFGAYIGINIVTQTISNIISAVLLFSSAGVFSTLVYGGYNAGMGSMNLALGVDILLSVVFTAAAFWVTNYLLSKKLNLE